MEDRIRSGTRRQRSRRRRWVTGSIVTALLALTIAFPAHARSANAEVMDVQRAIEANNRAYVSALESHDVAAYSALFVDDAISLPPFGPLIRGRSAIEASMSAAFARVAFVDGAMHTLETRIMGDTTVELGAYHLVVRVDGYPMNLDGRYLTVWRRDGRKWKIAVDSSQPGPTTAARDADARQTKE